MISPDDKEKPVERQQCCLRLAKNSLPYVRDVLLLLSAAAVVLVTRRKGPAAAGFLCHDPSITYPFRGDSVSFTMLLLLTVLLPPVIIVPIELARQRRGITWSFRRPLWIAAVLSSRHVICQAFLLAVTEVMKSLVSRPRPNFLALCQPSYNATVCEEGSRFIWEFQCGSLTPSTSHYQEILVIDSMLSFPSGHAAVSCCTATFLALYLLSRSSGRSRTVLRSWLIACCVLYGTVITFSRVADHRHHLGDVLAGAALGVAAGVTLCYGVCRSMSKTSQRAPLLPQTSVASNRTSDTQVSSLEDEL